MASLRPSPSPSPTAHVFPKPDLRSCSGSGNEIICSNSGRRYCAQDEVCYSPTNAAFTFGEWGSLCHNKLTANVLGVRPSAHVGPHRLLIPSLFVFTYKCDLLANNSCAEGKYTARNEEVMRLNMWNTIKLHGGEVCSPMAVCPAATCMSCRTHRKTVQQATSANVTAHSWSPNVTVHFYDDEACERVIEKVAPAPLLRSFRAESQGMYKADICRGAALKRGGGFYFDLDLKARIDSRALIANTSTFVSCVEGAGVASTTEPRDGSKAAG